MNIDEHEGLIVLEPRELFDPAFLGVIHQAGIECALYSRTKVIAALVADGLDYESAVEHYGFNVSGSIGQGLPWFLMDEEDDA